MRNKSTVISFGDIFSKKELKTPQYQASVMKIAKMLQISDNIVVLPHTHADRDAWGSALGLVTAIKDMGKKVTVYAAENIPERLNFLPNKDLVVTNLQEDEDKFGLIVSVDSATRDLLGERQKLFDTGTSTINIDHHITNSKYAQNNLIVSSASSASEVVYDVDKNFTKKKY